MKGFNQSYPTQRIVLILDAIGHHIKSPGYIRLLLLELLVMDVPEDPIMIHGVFIAL